MPAGARHSHRILIADDEEGVRAALTEMLKAEGFACTTVSAGREALRSLRTGRYDVVLADVRLPDMSGLDLLSLVREKYPFLPVIVITGFASIESTIGALRRGAVDYLPKPFSRDAVIASVQQALAAGTAGGTGGGGAPEIVYRSAGMAAVGDLIGRVSRTDSTVLVTGESGTGKELVARAIHRMSRRAGQAFISVNSGALPEGLLESELFGHVRGAFTGAVSTSLGRFRVADGGSLFLDEVGNMSPAMQVKLLRVLQDQEFSPVGTSESIKVDVRLIAATNSNLEAAVKSGSFREDLYYRMNVIEISIPPLRERKDDIILLAEHFLSALAEKRHMEKWALRPDAQAALLAYSWPGNVRELENTMERATVLCEGSSIDASVLPGRISGAGERPALPDDAFGGAFDLPLLMDEIEKFYILSALRKTAGNRSAAAGLLGMKRTTLLARMQSLGLGRGKVH